ncbi:PKD domain-containing protein [Tepidibacter aestuarii]|uniref:PKD domain-containing protein n=1 Tax=Tepidibacter aestuarii TaxID=2925782 RepID=UPI0020BF73DD|nr:PKD domain-containing protein [Tepidibacter aestuarii]CAH2213518.1 protein of unknown function [Tepidibacter aestuarii]
MKNDITHKKRQNGEGSSYTRDLEDSSNSTPIADAGGPYTGDEGSPIIFDGSASYDPDGGTLEYRWDFDGDGIWDTSWSSQPTATYTFEDNCLCTVRLEVRDNNGATDTSDTTVTVNNVPSIVGEISLSNDRVLVNTEIVASANFTDPGILDTHTAEWDWGDSTTSPGEVIEVSGSGSVSGSHIYTKCGKYIITLKVTDKDGGVGTSTYKYVIIYSQKRGISLEKFYIQEIL